VTCGLVGDEDAGHPPAAQLSLEVVGAAQRQLQLRPNVAARIADEWGVVGSTMYDPEVRLANGEGGIGPCGQPILIDPPARASQ